MANIPESGCFEFMKLNLAELLITVRDGDATRIDEFKRLLRDSLTEFHIAEITGGMPSNENFNTSIKVLFNPPLTALERLEVLANAVSAVRHIYLPRSYGKYDEVQNDHE